MVFAATSCLREVLSDNADISDNSDTSDAMSFLNADNVSGFA